jgi:hypothetical protein
VSLFRASGPTMWFLLTLGEKGHNKFVINLFPVRGRSGFSPLTTTMFLTPSVSKSSSLTQKVWNRIRLDAHGWT